jgi:1,4-alpha-glucan branching enzyme
MYRSRLAKCWDLYVKKYRLNLIPALRGLMQRGRLELITTAATHGYLPIMDLIKPAVRAQVGTAFQLFKRLFGRGPRGFWLPECGYQPGQDLFLKDIGIRYFLVDSHAVLHATPEPKFGTFAPVRCPSGVFAFGRDMESSKQVWSATEGYPGDYDYREFYRDVGYDLDEEYLRPYLLEDGARQFTGLKYYRITGPGDHKEPYLPEAGKAKAELHAADFLSRKLKQAEFIAPQMDRPPLMMCMYDAELFGHWWFEGLDFLEAFFRRAASQAPLALLTPSSYLRRHPRNQAATPAASSWGDRGYAEYWLNRSNDWIYRHLFKAGERMIELAARFKNAKGGIKRALNQAARELMLAQASDWAFMMKTGSHAPYAVKRTETHLVAFNRLYNQITSRRVDRDGLKELEGRDNLFPDMDYRLYRDPKDASRGKKVKS